MTDTQDQAVATAARGAGMNTIGSVITAISQFVLAYLVAQFFGDTGAGIFLSATAIYMIAGNTAKIGSETAMVYFVSQLRAAEPTARVRPLTTQMLRPVMAASLVLTVVLLAVAGPLSRLIADDAADDLRWSIIATVPFLLAWPLSAVYLGASRGLGSMRPTATIHQITRPLLQLGGVIVGAAFDVSLPILCLLWAIPIVVTVPMARRAFLGLDGTTDVALPSRSAIWAFARPRGVSTSFQIAMERLDVLIVSAIAGEGAAGVYGTLSRLITSGNFFMFSVSQAMAPQISKLFAIGDLPGARRLYHATAAWTMISVWPLFLICATRPETALGVFGDEFVAGADALRILGIGMLFASAFGPVDFVLLMRGRSARSLGNISLALAVNVILDLVLVPAYGINGAAIAWVAGVVVYRLLPTWQIFRDVQLVPFGRPGLLVGMLAVAVFGGAGLIPATDVLPVAGISAIAGLAFVGVLYVLRGPLDLAPAAASLKAKFTR